MKQLFINVSGHNGSGKTVVAKKLEQTFGFSRVSGDELRQFICGSTEYFKGTDWTYPSQKTKELNPLISLYRLELTSILLEAGQSVINDGGGANREFRSNYLARLRQKFPDVYTVIVWIDIEENELLERLKTRDKNGGQWTRMYHEIRKTTVEPPADDEADLVLHYDQHNYDKIEQTIKALLV